MVQTAPRLCFKPYLQAGGEGDRTTLKQTICIYHIVNITVHYFCLLTFFFSHTVAQNRKQTEKTPNLPAQKSH